MAAQIPRSQSDFHHKGIDALRAMISNANPSAARKAGDNWKSIADQLGGEDGTGGLAKEFKEAVTEAEKSWSGEASKKFKEAAADVLEKINRTYRHARNTQLTMIGNGEIGSCTPGMESAAQIAGPGSVAQTLAEAKYTMEKIDDPSKTERMGDKVSDGGRDDSQFHEDMANPNIDVSQALEAHRGDLSVSKERQVEAVIVMETLAFNYRQHTYNFRDTTVEDGSNWPSQPNQQTPVGPIPMPIPGGAGAGKSVALQAGGGSGVAEVGQGVNSPRPDGISGGIGTGGAGAGGPGLAKPGAEVGMGLSSAGGSGLSGGGAGVGNLSSSPGSGGVGAGSGTGAGPGVVGGLGAGGGTRGGASGARGGRMGGMPGMGGAGAGGAKGTGKGAGGRGGLAKQRGGVVGAAGGKAASARGGAGLHRSRGGSQAGKAGAGRGAGMTGAPGSRGAGAKDDKDRSQRPDYLVEDEETWTPNRNVTPKVIE